MTLDLFCDEFTSSLFLYSLVKSAASQTQGEGQVGRLGHQSRDMALSCLQACPLLENLSDWSQWQMVFEPELGDLKQFILKHGGCHTVQLTGTRDILSVPSVLSIQVSLYFRTQTVFWP